MFIGTHSPMPSTEAPCRSFHRASASSAAASRQSFHRNPPTVCDSDASGSRGTMIVRHRRLAEGGPGPVASAAETPARRFRRARFGAGSSSGDAIWGRGGMVSRPRANRSCRCTKSSVPIRSDAAWCTWVTRLHDGGSPIPRSICRSGGPSRRENGVSRNSWIRSARSPSGNTRITSAGGVPGRVSHFGTSNGGWRRRLPATGKAVRAPSAPW